MSIDNGGVPRGSSTLERGRALGASPLTIRIYQAVLDAGPLTAKEIHQWIRDRVGTAYDTDIRIWAQGKVVSSPLDIQSLGVRRVRERIGNLVRVKHLISDGLTGRGNEPHYSAGSPPHGFKSYKRLGPWGWYEVDVKAAEAWRDQTIARATFLDRVRTELQKKHMANARELLTEAVRLLS